MFNTGDIVVIPFPFSDLSATKKRPVLALSQADRNGDFVCLAVTSKGYHSAAIAITQDSMNIGVLPKASWIRTDKIFTLSGDLVIKSIGSVNPSVVEYAVSDLCERLRR